MDIPVISIPIRQLKPYSVFSGLVCIGFDLVFTSLLGVPAIATYPLSNNMGRIHMIGQAKASAENSPVFQNSASNPLAAFANPLSQQPRVS